MKSADLKPYFTTPNQSNAFANLAPEIKKLSQLKQRKGILAAFLDWVVILLAIRWFAVEMSILRWALMAVIVGSRQHGLAILMHDAAHFRLLRNKKFNDLVSNCFLAYPLFITTEKYRTSHLAHHLYLNSEKDPDFNIKRGKKDWTFPKNKMQLTLLLGKMLLYGGIVELGRNFTRYSSSKTANPKEKNKASSAVKTTYYLGASIGLTYFGGWGLFLLCWFLPMITFLSFNLRVRSMAEHFGMEWTNDFNMSRTTLCSAWEKILIARHNVGFHIEHHLYPSVPFYNLRKVHLLLKNIPEFEQEAHISKSYFGKNTNSLIAELTGGKSAKGNKQKAPVKKYG